jgi:GWxTD domain-containing protein
MTTARMHIPRRWLGVLFLLAALVAAPAFGKKPTAAEDLFNPFLGIDYSYWLVGAIAQIATEDEVRAYLALTTDAEAKAFVDAFWAKRNVGTAVFKKTPQQLFELRSADADKRFSERTYPGRRTDRGATFILYGEPEKIEFQSPLKVNDYTLEVWSYAKDAEPGLDGQKPKRQIRFVEIEGKTVFYKGQAKRPDPRQQHRRPGN